MNILKYKVVQGQTNELLSNDTDMNNKDVGLICIPISIENAEGYAHFLVKKYRFEGEVSLTEKGNHYKVYRNAKPADVTDEVDADYNEFMQTQSQPA